MNCKLVPVHGVKGQGWGRKEERIEGVGRIWEAE